MSETTESPNSEETEPKDVVALTVELAQAHANIKILAEMVQRDAYARQTLAPIVDLIAMWQEELKLDNTNPQKVVAEFSVHAARYFGMYDQWLISQTKKYPIDDTDASR